MFSARIVKSIDVLEHGGFDLTPCLPALPPVKFCLQRFEVGFRDSIVPAISFARHRYLEAVQAEDFLVLVRTILAATIGIMNAPFGGWRRLMAIFNAQIAKSFFSL